ncbi:MAG: hypothetical protein WCA08_20125 [Desulfoferrobacter sp.]
MAHHLFGAEGHKINVNLTVPGLTNTIKVLLSIYVLYTCLVSIILFILGVPFADSLCHPGEKLGSSIDYRRPEKA